MNEITKQKKEFSETVCAVVVTYNRKKLLIECLDALLEQTRPVDAIYIIDNFSNDGTPDLLKEKNYIHELPPRNLKEPWKKEFEIMNLTERKALKIYYVRMHENTGGAGGFYEGVKRGYDEGYDWLWVMDDDAEPRKNCLEILLTNVNYYKDLAAAICPLIIGKNNSYQLYHHKIINRVNMIEKAITKNINELDILTEIDANAFVGPLINSTYISKAGFPTKELFIWGDDTEYTFRLHTFGNIYLCKNAIILHKDNSFNGITPDTVWKRFYFYRNKIILIRKFCKFKLVGYIYYTCTAFRASLILLIKYHYFKNFLIPIKGVMAGFIFKLK